MRYRLKEGVVLSLAQGDLTRADVDAIVNAANERMLGGGGVDGAIHRAAGPRLLAACAEVPESRPGVRCPTGSARITPGFDLRARWVIHTVGPVYSSARESAGLLEMAYGASVALAIEEGLRSLAFPAISCGVYGYPLEEASRVAIGAVRDAAASPLEEVSFVLFDDAAFGAWRAAADAMLERERAS